MTTNLLWDASLGQSWLKTISEQLGGLNTKATTISNQLATLNALLQVGGDTYSQLENIKLHTQNTATNTASSANELENLNAYLEPMLGNKLQAILDAIPAGEDYRIYIDDIEDILRDLLTCCRTPKPITVQPQISMSIFGEMEWNDPPEVKQLEAPSGNPNPPKKCPEGGWWSYINSSVDGLMNRSNPGVTIPASGYSWGRIYPAVNVWGFQFVVDDDPNQSGITPHDHIKIMSLPEEGTWYYNHNYGSIWHYEHPEIGIVGSWGQAPIVRVGSIIEFSPGGSEGDSYIYCIPVVETPDPPIEIDFCPTADPPYNPPEPPKQITVVQQGYDEDAFRCQKAHWFAEQIETFVNDCYDIIDIGGTITEATVGGFSYFKRFAFAASRIVAIVGAILVLITIDRAVWQKAWDWYFKKAIICALAQGGTPTEVINRYNTSVNHVTDTYMDALIPMPMKPLWIVAKPATKTLLNNLIWGDEIEKFDELTPDAVAHYPKVCCED